MTTSTDNPPVTPPIPPHRHYAQVTHETQHIARNGQLVEMKLKNKRFPYCKLCGEFPTSELYKPKPQIGKPMSPQENT